MGVAESGPRTKNGVKEIHMWNTNERRGKVDQAKGRIKQAIGALTGDEPLKAEGQVDETVGKLEEAVGHVARKTGDAIADVGKAVKH